MTLGKSSRAFLLSVAAALLRVDAALPALPGLALQCWVAVDLEDWAALDLADLAMAPGRCDDTPTYGQ